MPPDDQPDATGLLLAWSKGDSDALDRLVPLVHQELHRLAVRYMRRERADHPLQPTALVNEAYLRLMDVTRVQWHDRAHFLAVAAQAMRRILVDFARQRHSRNAAAISYSSAWTRHPTSGRNRR
jgi:RNA polymerase sigma factor (TIGR02999 family)